MVSKPSKKPIVMLSTQSLTSFPTVAFETVPVFVWLTIYRAEKQRQLNFLHWLPHLVALAGDGSGMLADNGLAGKTLGKWVYCSRWKDTGQVSVLFSLERHWASECIALAGKTLGKWVYCPRWKDTGQVSVLPSLERHWASECIALAGKTLGKWVYCPRWKDTGQVSVSSSLERHWTSECIALAGKTLDKWVYCPRWKDTGQVSVSSSLERHWTSECIVLAGKTLDKWVYCPRWKDTGQVSVSPLEGLCTLPVVRRARCEDCWQFRVYRCQRCC